MPLAAADEPLPTSPPAPSVLLVTVAGALYGIALEAVLEVVPARPLTRLPGAPRPVAGMVNVRGRMVTVVDLADDLSLPAAASHPGHRLVVVGHRGRRVALAVHDVARIVAPPEPRTGSPPPAADPSPDVPAFQLLDVDALLHPIFG